MICTSKTLSINFKRDTTLIKHIYEEFLQCAGLEAQKDIRQVRITDYNW